MGLCSALNLGRFIIHVNDLKSPVAVRGQEEIVRGGDDVT